MAKSKRTRSSGKTIAAKQAGQYSSHDASRRSTIAVICISAVILLIAFLIGLSFLLKNPAKAARIPANVSAAGVNLGGMTQDEAENALRAATQNSYSRTSMVIQILDTTYELTPVDTGAALDVSAVAKAAIQLTSGDPQIMDISPYLTLDQSAIEAVVAKLGTQYNSEFSQSSYHVEEQAAPDDSEAPAAKTLVLNLGTPRYVLNTEALYRQILTAYNNNIFYVEAECSAEEPNPLDLDAIYQEYCSEPIDAEMDMETFEITKETYGYSFDLESAKEAIANAQYGDEIQISIDPVAPEVTAESLQNTLFRDELSSASTECTSNENRNTNLRLACEAINNLVLQPGDIFSFNATLGERTTEKGYKSAGAYIGGQTVDSIGGGICQVASTIYYCALLADMEIVDRTCHMYPVSYLPYGMDATIYWGSLDFRFRNNTDYPLRIEAEMSGGYVNIRLVGTDTKDYYVKMEYEIKETYPPKTIYEEMTADNPDGYKDGDVITSPYTGYCVYSYRCKYDKETDALISRDFEDTSNYSSRDKVVCKIIDNSIPDPTEISPTDPEIIGGGGVSEDPGD